MTRNNEITNLVQLYGIPRQQLENARRKLTRIQRDAKTNLADVQCESEKLTLESRPLESELNPPPEAA